MMAIQFVLSEEQCNKFSEWSNSELHEKCYQTAAKTAIGGLFTFRFTDTTLGTVCKVSCGVCKIEIDLSDYDDW